MKSSPPVTSDRGPFWCARSQNEERWQGAGSTVKETVENALGLWDVDDCADGIWIGPSHKSRHGIEEDSEDEFTIESDRAVCITYREAKMIASGKRRAPAVCDGSALFGRCVRCESFENSYQRGVGCCVGNDAAFKEKFGRSFRAGAPEGPVFKVKKLDSCPHWISAWAPPSSTNSIHPQGEIGNRDLPPSP